MINQGSIIMPDRRCLLATPKVKRVQAPADPCSVSRWAPSLQLAACGLLATVLLAAVLPAPAAEAARARGLLARGPVARGTSTSATFSFSARVRCRLDRGRWRSCGRRARFAVGKGWHDLLYQRLARRVPRGAVLRYHWLVLAAPSLRPDGPQTSWRPVGSAPLADALASSAVVRTVEVRRQNSEANRYVPSDGELAAFHAARGDQGESESTFNAWRRYVTGRPGLANPTTDELIQWAALKWGIPVDVMRAQMAVESWWRQDAMGDPTTVSNPQDYPAFSRIPGTSDVYQSLGISQVRWPTHPGTEPLRWRSTAFNLDVYGAEIRFYYDGLAASWGQGMTDRGYGPGQEWLSIGAWFNPYPWNNAGQQDYVGKVQQYLRDRVWDRADFLSG
jgi:hypothetical protein